MSMAERPGSAHEAASSDAAAASTRTSAANFRSRSQAADYRVSESITGGSKTSHVQYYQDIRDS
jgi:hypothetical protein